MYRWICYLFKCHIPHPFVPTISPEFSHISLESTSSEDKKPRFPSLHICFVKPFSAFCSTQENVFHTRIYTRWVQSRNWFMFLWEPADRCLPFILKYTKGVWYHEWQVELARTCINVKTERATRGDSKTSEYAGALLGDLSASGQFLPEPMSSKLTHVKKTALYHIPSCGKVFGKCQDIKISVFTTNLLVDLSAQKQRGAQTKGRVSFRELDSYPRPYIRGSTAIFVQVYDLNRPTSKTALCHISGCFG